jgi:transcriptional regulator with XRE-family HTH domain
MNLLEYLASVLHREKITLQELEKLTGINKSVFSRWSNGKCQPTIYNIKKLVEVIVQHQIDAGIATKSTAELLRVEYICKILKIVGY